MYFLLFLLFVGVFKLLEELSISYKKDLFIPLLLLCQIFEVVKCTLIFFYL